MKRKLISVLCILMIVVFPLQSVAFAANDKEKGNKSIPANGSGTGLKAEYFDNQDFTNLKLTRTDAQVDFDWGSGSPNAAIASDTFSVRWSGFIQPKFSEKYFIYTNSDDGIRLWINGQLLINHWTDHAVQEDKEKIELIAGQKYEIKIEYYENCGLSTASLLWSSPSQKKEVVPATQLYSSVSPGIPSNFTTSATDTEITVSWDAFADAQGYDVQLDGSAAIINNGTSTTYTYSGLKPNTSHTIRVRTRNISGTSAWSNPVTVTTLMGSGNGTGLKGEYFDNSDFTNLQLTRIDGQVNFDWSNGAPYSTIGADTFSVRWSGSVQPKFSETYTFYTVSDDGVRLWVNGQLIVDNWTLHAAREDKGTIALAAGQKYDIKMEYFENYGYTAAKLLWSSSSQKKELIPATQLYPAAISGVPSNFTVSASETEITIGWDAFADVLGYDVELDGAEPTVDNGTNTTYKYSGLKPNTSHTLRVRTRNSTGTSEWCTPITISTLMGPGTGTGLKGEYYDNKDFTSLKDTRTDAQVNFDWGNGAPSASVGADTFSVRWSGFVQPKMSETYTFYTVSDDGVRLWVNGEKIIDNWTLHSATENKGTIALEAGKKYSIVMEYFENSGQAVAKLLWSSPGQKKEVIPASQLYSAKALAVPGNIVLTAEEKGITLTWDAVDGVKGYEVEADGKVLDAGANNTYTVSGLLPGTSHQFKVRAKSEDVTGEWSPVVSESTTLGSPANVVTDMRNTSINYTWDAVEGASGYDIEMDGTTYSTEVNTYLFTDLQPDSQHTFKVRTKTADVNGQWSSETVVRTLPNAPVTPANFTATATSSEIALTWDAVSDAVEYFVNIDGTMINNNTATSYIHSGLLPETTHVYSVMAKNLGGESEWSPSLTVTTIRDIPGIPVNLKAEAGAAELVFTWDAVEGATSYEVAVNGGEFDNISNPAYIISHPTPNTTYTFKVRAVNSSGKSDWSSESTYATLPEKPITPTNVVAKAINTEVVLAWDVIPGAESYDIEADGKIFENGASTTYTHSGLEPLSTHHYRVLAKNAGGASEWSEITSITTLPNPPGAPVNITVTSTATTVTLTWDAVEGATGYTVEVDGETRSNGLETSFIHTEVLPESQHTYKVKVENAGGESDWSNAVTATTLPLAPGIPVSLSGTATLSSVTLIWEPVEGATGYDIEANGVLIGSSSVLNYTHSDLTPGTEYIYCVRAKNAGGESDWSNPYTIRTKEFALTAPANISATAATKAIAFSWDAVADATGYDIEVDKSVIGNISATSYEVTGLKPDTTHTYRIRSRNSYGASEWSETYTLSTLLPEPGTGVGLKGEYYSGQTFNTLKLTRVDRTINFNWSTGSPDATMPSDFFTIRWTGFVQPRYTDTYTFYTNTDNGVRLWVNGQLLIDKWGNVSGENSGTIDLVAGEKYDIKMEYLEVSGSASAKLSWESRKQTKEIVPQSQLYIPLPGIPAKLTTANVTDTAISIAWNAVDTASGYDVEADGTVTDVGAGTSFVQQKLKPDSQHIFKVRAKNATGAGEWSDPLNVLTLPIQGSGTGLRGEYYKGTNFNTSTLLRTDATVNFNWGTGAPDPLMPQDFFTIRWTGFVQPKYSGTYTFYTNTDNGVKLWVNGQLLIDKWGDVSGENSGTIDLIAGEKYSIRMEYLEMSGGAYAKLSWASSRQAKEIIPQSYLYIPLPAAPAKLTASKVTDTEATITWEGVESAIGYEVEVDGAVVDNGLATSFTKNGLKADSHHSFKVRAKNISGTGDWSSAIDILTLPIQGSGIGLKGDYYKGLSFNTLVLTRTDSTVNFNWGTNAPDKLMPADAFTIRWTGFVQPRYTGTYTFYINSDNGAKLWVNGQQLIDKWGEVIGENSGTVDLVAGEKYDIQMEYVEVSGGAYAKLSWSSERQAKEIIPTNYLYVPLPGIPGKLTASKVIDTEVTLSWNAVDGATGYDVEADGQTIENIVGTSYTHQGLKPDTTHTYKVRARNSTGYGEWSNPLGALTLPILGTGTGLKGQYYKGTAFNTLVLERTDSTVNFNWSTGSPDPAVPNDFFTARWTGSLLARYTGTYTFYTNTDNGVRLWVNGQLIIDKWGDVSGENSGTIDLVAGQKYDIKMEYVEMSGSASAKLMWFSDRQAKEIIPQAYLYTP